MIIWPLNYDKFQTYIKALALLYSKRKSINPSNKIEQVLKAMIFVNSIKFHHFISPLCINKKLHKNMSNLHTFMCN